MPFYTEQALATLTLPSAPEIISPWLTAGSVALVFGPPSAGKTMWTASVSQALATGRILFGAYPCAKSRVLIVQADMPTVAVIERAQARAAELSADVGVWLTENSALDVLTVNQTHASTLAEAQGFKPDVVFVDTLRKTHHLDENDSSAPDRVYAAWRALFPGAAFVFLHHSRKLPTTPNADATMREAFRGSMAWAASADTIIAIRRRRLKGSKEWLVQQHFIRTRNCAEPRAIMLRRTDALTLAPVAEMTLELRLIEWLGQNPQASRAEAVKWLQTLREKNGQVLCSQATAYRLYASLSA